MAIIQVGPTRAITTINGGIAAAAPGDTVQVDPGTYSEVVVVNISITLNGAQSGRDARTRDFVTLNPAIESIVLSSDVTGTIQCRAPNVIVDGFAAIRNNTGGISAGIYTDAAFSGYVIQNNILEDNAVGLSFNALKPSPAVNTAQQNLFFRNNSLATAGFGQGVWATQGGDSFVVTRNLFAGLHLQASVNFSGSSNVTIDHNEMKGGDNSIALTATSDATVTHNTLRNTNGSAVFLGGGTTNTTVSHNTIQNSLGSAISVTTAFTPSPNAHAVGHGNNIENNAGGGVQLASGSYTGTLNLTNNYWNSANGPSIATQQVNMGDVIIDPNGNVTYVPFATVPF